MSQSLVFKDFKQHLDFLYESSISMFDSMHECVNIPDYQNDSSGPLNFNIDLETNCVHYSWDNDFIEHKVKGRGGKYQYYIPIRAFYEDEYFEQVVQTSLNNWTDILKRSKGTHNE
jgi:hypothetical protein